MGNFGVRMRGTLVISMIHHLLHLSFHRQFVTDCTNLAVAERASPSAESQGPSSSSPQCSPNCSLITSSSSFVIVEKRRGERDQSEKQSVRMGRVMVTGASGYMGGRLCVALVHAGHSVVALVRKTSKLEDLPPEVELVEGDIRDAEAVRRACEGCEYVVHTAAAVGSWLPDSSLFVKVNVEGLKVVIEAVKATPSIKRLIYTSSFFALGPTDGYIGDETQFHSLKTFSSPYEESKALADKVALEAATEGVPIVCLYPGVIYGPGAMTKGNSLAEMMIERFNGRMPGYVGARDRKIFSFCHIDDVVVAFLAAMEMGKEGDRYLLCGENLSFHEVFDIAARLTNTSPPKFTVPMWILDVAGFLCVQWARFGAWTGISHQVPLITSQSVDILKHQWAYSSAKAERELGYKSRPFEEGLRGLLEWLKAKGLIKY